MARSSDATAAKYSLSLFKTCFYGSCAVHVQNSGGAKNSFFDFARKNTIGKSVKQVSNFECIRDSLCDN